jgi:hypothetical protein
VNASTSSGFSQAKHLRFPAVLSALGVLLLLLVFQLVLSVRLETQTWDEACHIWAGYSYWKHGDFGISPEHPPLVRLLAAAPLLAMVLREPPAG